MSQHFVRKFPNSVIATAGKERSDCRNAIAGFPIRVAGSDISQIRATSDRSLPDQLKQQATNIMVRRFGFPTLAYDRRECWMRKPANVVDKEPRSALIILTVLPYECADEVLSRRKGKRSRIAKGDQR